MLTAKRTGMGFIALALATAVVTGLSTPPDRETMQSKSYTLAVSGWSRLHLIELGTDWPTKTRHADDQLMFCLHVVRLASFEIGARCASEATTIADAAS